MTKRLLAATALMACLPMLGAAEGLTKPVLGYEAAGRMIAPASLHRQPPGTPRSMSWWSMMAVAWSPPRG